MTFFGCQTFDARECYPYPRGHLQCPFGREVGRALMRRKISAFMVAALIAGGLAVSAATPASAASCTYDLLWSTVTDYASARRVSGSCAEIGVRHYAKPAGSAPAYWTSWFWDRYNPQTYVAPELQTAQGSSR